MNNICQPPFYNFIVQLDSADPKVYLESCQVFITAFFEKIRNFLQIRSTGPSIKYVRLNKLNVWTPSPFLLILTKEWRHQSNRRSFLARPPFPLPYVRTLWMALQGFIQAVLTNGLFWNEIESSNVIFREKRSQNYSTIKVQVLRHCKFCGRSMAEPRWVIRR